MHAFGRHTLVQRKFLPVCVGILLVIFFLVYFFNNPIVPCTNTKPFVTPTDLSLAFKMVLQKQAQSNILSKLLIAIPSYRNCLNLDRGDLDEQDSGYAVIVPTSTLQKIHIYVDYLYKSQDPVLTGYLLVGKLARANDFILSQSHIYSVSCSEQNIHDIQAQLFYLQSLSHNELLSPQAYLTKQLFSVKDTLFKKILIQQLQVVSSCRKGNYICDQKLLDYPKTHNMVVDGENQCF